jgi:hypothetical protein
MSLVQWHNSMDGPPVVDNARSVPKRAVIWFGEIWLTLPTGEKDTRAWRANKPITRQQAQTVMAQLLASLVGEHGKDAAVDAGFWMRSR